MTDDRKSVPSVSVSYARTGSSAKANALGMRPMQERAYEKRGEQYLLIKSPPASGKSRALMFVALDKLANQGAETGDHRGAGEEHRRQLQRRAAQPLRLLGGLACGAPVESVQRAGRGRRKGEVGRRVPRERRPGARLHPRHLPLRGRSVRHRGVRPPADRGGRVPTTSPRAPTTSWAFTSASSSRATRCIWSQ